MKKLLTYFSFLLLISLPTSCVREAPEVNSSQIQSIKMNTSLFQLQGYLLDNTGNTLFVLGYDYDNDASICFKINVQTMQLIKKVVVSEKYELSGYHNLAFNQNNQLVMILKGIDFTDDLVAIYDTDFNLLNSFQLSGNHDYIVPRLCINNNNEVVVSQNLKEQNRTDGGSYMLFNLFDMNLNRLKQVYDTSLSDVDILISTSLKQLPDGGYLSAAGIFNKPDYNTDLVYEKRDANLNLVWQTKYTGQDQPSGVGMFVDGNSTFSYFFTDDVNNDFKTVIRFLNLDGSGNITSTKDINFFDVNDRNSEVVLKTDDGGYILTAMTTIDKVRKGVVYKTDANFNITHQELFGSKGNVSQSGLLKLTSDRYLLFYLDNGFTPDGSGNRMVLRQVNSDGEIIKD